MKTEYPKWKPVGPELGPDTIGKVTAFVIDTKGNRWLWNCGWYIVDKKGEPLKTRAKPLVNFFCFESKHDDNRVHLSKTYQRPDSRQQPMTHVEFRKNVKILNASDKKQREVLHGLDKPGRHWRRFVHRDSWVHDLFGACYLLASDGCHAVIETVDGDHEYVCFENLSENTGVKLPPRFGESKPSTKVRERKVAEVSALISKYITAVTK